MHRPFSILLSASCLTAAASSATSPPAGAMNVFFIAVDGRSARVHAYSTPWAGGPGPVAGTAAELIHWTAFPLHRRPPGAVWPVIPDS